MLASCQQAVWYWWSQLAAVFWHRNLRVSLGGPGTSSVNTSPLDEPKAQSSELAPQPGLSIAWQGLGVVRRKDGSLVPTVVVGIDA